MSPQHLIDTKIYNNYERYIPNCLNMSNKVIEFPNCNQHDLIYECNYKLDDLKTIARFYKIQSTGTKIVLKSRIFGFLYMTKLAIKIQKIYRGFLQRLYEKCHGPAYKNRMLCVNCTDFLSFDEIIDIDNSQFFSYKDQDNFIYGFDIISFFNLIKKSSNVINPYNRLIINKKVINNFCKILSIGKILEKNICTDMVDATLNLSAAKCFEMRVIELFQNIDALGNYSNPSWFLSLSNNSLIKFIKELGEIWNFRAQLTTALRVQLYPPHGNPFIHINIASLIIEPQNTKLIVLELMEVFVKMGINTDNKTLGSYYVLGALTLVNQDAANALPWLFQSFSYV